jgi:hypothetical protein
MELDVVVRLALSGRFGVGLHGLLPMELDVLGRALLGLLIRAGDGAPLAILHDFPPLTR